MPTSEKGTTSLQRTRDLSPMCPLFGGSTVVSLVGSYSLCACVAYMDKSGDKNTNDHKSADACSTCSTSLSSLITALTSTAIVAFSPHLSYKCHQCKFNVCHIFGTDFKIQKVVSIGKAPSILIGYLPISKGITFCWRAPSPWYQEVHPFWPSYPKGNFVKMLLVRNVVHCNNPTGSSGVHWKK